MIIKLLCSPLFVLASTIISILPFSNAQSNITSVFGMLSIAFQFFPTDVWVLAFGSIIFWLTVHVVVAVFHFVTGVIPFLNIRVG